MTSGATVWGSTSPVILTVSAPSCYPPVLAVTGTHLWVSFSSPLSPFILDTATGAVLASNFTPPGMTSCSMLTPKFAVCGGASGDAATAVFSTAVLPPTPLWSNLMYALLIASDLGANGQLLANTGDTDQQLTSFDLATGDLVWTFPTPWVIGSALFAYDDAGTLWAAWRGYDALQHFTVVIATYNIAAAAPTQTANVSLPLPPYSSQSFKINGFSLSNNGRLAVMVVSDGTHNSVVTVAAAAAGGALTIKSAVFSAPSSTQVQAIPGPQNGQLIIGQLDAAGVPSMAVYA